MATNINTVRYYWREVRKYRVGFFVSLVAIPISALLLDTLLPYFLSLSIGDLASKNSDNIFMHLLTAGVVGLIGILLNIIGFQTLIRHESNVRTSLANMTFSELLRKDYTFFVNEKVGALTSRYIDFIRSHMGLQDLLIIRTLGFVLSVSTGLVIVALNAPIVAIGLAALIVIILLQVKISTKIRAPYRHERKELVGEIHGKVADVLTNNLVTKTFAREEQEASYINKQYQRLNKIYVKDLGLFGIDGSIRIFMMTTIQIVSISACVYLVFNGQLSIAIAIFVLTYLQRISSQIFALGEILNGYDQLLLEASPMSDIIGRPVLVNDRPDAYVLQDITPNITFNDVTYRYEDNKSEVLDNINLSIKAGEKIGLVGHSGAGKTTITHLLLRFDDVSGGTIMIDGHDIRDVTQRSLRESIAYVPQEPMLLHRTLRENITYGNPNATNLEVRQATKKANALDFIDKLPKGIDTIVGERGVKLSGGQRQRIAIARAILKNAPILVLDEATSALDSESEKLIQDALVKLMKGRTSIVIAHRLSTIAKLDRIIVLDNGRIIEEGTHIELLKNNGTYAKLWGHQSGGFMED